MPDLTHLDESGAARMVDVSDKTVTKRSARAMARVQMRPETLALILEGGIEKGDVFATARIAGIQAAKKTADLIPLCHPLALSSVTVEFEHDTRDSTVTIITECRLPGRTGVEMEALTAASVAALTLYDMCKAVDKGMEISRLCLLEKSGGKSGEWQRDA